jgi:hypothetical protein
MLQLVPPYAAVGLCSKDAGMGLAVGFAFGYGGLVRGPGRGSISVSISNYVTTTVIVKPPARQYAMILRT